MTLFFTSIKFRLVAKAFEIVFKYNYENRKRNSKLGYAFFNNLK